MKKVIRIPSPVSNLYSYFVGFSDGPHGRTCNTTTVKRLAKKMNTRDAEKTLKQVKAYYGYAEIAQC